MIDLIPCAQKDDELLADIRGANVGSGFAVWWLGQSGFLVKTRGGVILFDPYLSDSLTKKYAGTDKPHVRMTERAIDPARLDMVDVVTSSHNHTDHLDAETLIPLLDANPKAAFIHPEANRAFVEERLTRGGGIGLDEQVVHRDVNAMTFYGIPAAHNRIDRDEQGRSRFMGYIAEFPGGFVYHSGDTLAHDEFEWRMPYYDIDVAILPINGNRPERRVAGNLFGDEAARLAKAIGAKLVVPCHYDMFTFNTEPPDLFMRECERIGQPYRVLRCGERLDITTEKTNG